VIIGFVIVLPVAGLNWASAPSQEDAFNAMEPIVRIPLAGLRTTGSAQIVFDVPSNRISRAWGNPFYVVFWRSQKNGWWIHSFSLLHVDVNILVSGSPVTLSKDTHFPYGHSSDTRDTGPSFVAKPGDEVRIAVVARAPESLPDGELVVAPDWNLPIKDRLVGMDVDKDLYHIARLLGWVGLVLVAGGSIGFPGLYPQK
jgi:hypothetical protein